MVFTDFFYNLKKRNVPVTLTEWLVFINALQRNLMDCNSQKFYYVARALLVKKENYFDNFDEAFLETGKKPTWLAIKTPKGEYYLGTQSRYDVPYKSQ
jgi:uncharacterized protein with von Willebrand factor type A (vWA) domain